jgi:AraC-like DNA-binding protein
MYRPLVYESWDDSDKILPERTHLYHLQPLGIGSIFVESLTGYIARLAEAHDISPAMLLNRELLPRMRATSNSGLRKAAVPMDSTFLYDSHVLNGAGEHPPNCVQVLENLTGTENLRAMTLLRLGEVLSAQHLLRAQQAWCPACLEEWRCSGSPIYEPLLWAIACVSYCPAHRCALSARCPHCGQTLHTLSARSRPGYCCRCQQWLGQQCALDWTSSAAQASLLVAHNIGHLLAACAETAFSGDLFKTNLRRCIGSLTDGNINRFCAASGMTYDSAAHWLSANGRIRLELLLSVCTRLELSPLRFLTEPLVDTDFEPARDVIRRNTAHIRTRRAQIRINEHLTRALREEPPISLREVASQLGYSLTRSLRRRNPDVCNQISDRHRKATIRTPAPPLLATVPSNETIRRALRRALAQSPRVPVKTVARNLGFRNVVSLYNRFPDLCRAFAAANKTEKAERLAPMRAAVESALTEHPPPTACELATRLGCTDSVLKYRFPELRAALLKRLPERKRFMDEQLVNAIQRASIEEPAPSIEAVAQRVGKSEERLRTTHRDLWKLIKSRHRAQQQLEAASRRATFRAEIACAVVELRQRGITPSRLKVFASIPNPSMRSTSIIDQQIAATLREMEGSPANIATGGRS